MSRIATFIPLEDILPWWPEHLFGAPDPGVIAITGYRVQEAAGRATGSLDLLLGSGLVFSVAGLDEVSLEAPGGSVTVEVDYTGPFELRVSNIAATLRIASPAIVPVSGSHPDWVPLLDASGTPEPVAVVLDIGSLVVDEDFAPVFELTNEVGLPPFMIGGSGIVVEASGIRLLLSGKDVPPPGLTAGFRGVFVERASVYLPSSFALPNLSPDALVLSGLSVGKGGVSGTITGQWNATWNGLEPSGSGAGTFLGLAFALRELAVSITQNALALASFEGDLAVPFFDQVLAVAVAIDADGQFALQLTAADQGLVTLRIPGLLTLEVTSLGAVHDADGDALLISGRLTLEAGSPALQWPTIEVQDLRIAPDGKVHVPGGWIDLQEPVALDLYGFGMEISRVGFGTEEDGRRWIGVDGALRLTELLPAGASARGLRVLWDPQRPTPLPSIALDGVGIFFGVPDAFGFEGEVALTDDPATGAKLFVGLLGLGLDALDIGIDGGIAIGRAEGVTYVFLHLGVEVPIPIAATGTALYGLQGLFAMNMSPVITHQPWPDADTPTVKKGDWYGWYKVVPREFTVTDPFKWSPDPGAWAFGAGLSLGTLPDAGWSVSTKALIVVLLPGPVILLQGKADLFKVPAALGSTSEEGTLGLLAALDGRAGTLQLGIDAAWSLGRVIEIAAATEAFFDFDRTDAWHLWIGKDTPESARIRADVLSLFFADSWLMLDAKGLGTGAGVGWGDSWKFGPVRLTLGAWIGGLAAIATRPPQLSGALSLGGEAAVEAGPFGVGIAVEAGLSGESFSPFEVGGMLAVEVGLPKPFKDLEVEIELKWSQPATPVVEDPWSGALLDHERCTESWTPVEGGSTAGSPNVAAPVVPLDAHVLLSFTQPMGDETTVADNQPANDPTVAIGKYEAAYAITALRLYRWRRTHPAAGWVDVSDTVFGTWTPDTEEAGTRLQLWARSPFAFTRFTSRRWTDAFLDRLDVWPCSPRPPDPVPVCIDWAHLKVGTRMAPLWHQDGATLASGAHLEVFPGGSGQRVLNLGMNLVGEEQRPGVLWVGLPFPAAEVTADVHVPIGDRVVLRAWSNDVVVGSDTRRQGAGELRVTGRDITAVTLEWGLNAEVTLARLCWVSQAEIDAVSGSGSLHDRLLTAATRWESDEPILDPESHYLLEVTTRATLAKTGAEIQRVEATHAIQFQTGGPPGLIPDWVPAPPPPEPNTAERFPHGGPLADLARYVSRTIPDAGAVPVFRAYDLGCEFDATHVQQMYGADMRIRLSDANGLPALDDAGEPLMFENAWEEGPTATLTASEAAWLARLDDCTHAVAWTELEGDDVVHTQTAGLLYDPFSDLLSPDWTAFVLDPAETRPAHWHTDAGVLRQDVDVGGGDAAPDSPDKPGTVLVNTSVGIANVAVGTRAWAASGAFGVVFRWTGEGDYYRFSVGPQRFRLVRVQDGIVRELWVSQEGYAPDVALFIAVQAEGPRVRCQVDGRLVCDVGDAEAGAPAAGGVGLYTWNTATAVFDEIRARAWPGAALAAERGYTAALEASRPIFTDAFDDLDAFDTQSIVTGATVSTCSAAAGTASIARPKGANQPAVVALAGDSDLTDYVVEANARPEASGGFGLVARHTGPTTYLALELTPRVGRKLVESIGKGNGFTQMRVLWQDAADVGIGQDHALSLRCEGSAVTVSIDGETFQASTSLERGRFGLLSDIVTPDACAFTDLIVRSAPRAAVHEWSFTTSRYLGLPDLLDTYVGHAWPAEGAAPDRAALGTEAGRGAAALGAARSALEAARGALADAVDASELLEIPAITNDALAAAAEYHATSGAVYDALAVALGLPWQPTTPCVEIGTVTDGTDVVALVLDLPEPLPLERVECTLARQTGSTMTPEENLLLVWRLDGTRALLVRDSAIPFTPGDWTLDVVLHLDVGVERASWRRGGSTAPETGSLRFAV